MDAVVLGPTAAVALGRGFAAEVHVDLHIPYRAHIGDDRRGDPAGTFLGAGLRLAYAHDVGNR
ncbi:MAG: hypothetical protein KIT31_14925 [Deltaproteobacteria bacterium]|nr:hypothetical protein [Deltaproteobacteria bacterium]